MYTEAELSPIYMYVTFSLATAFPVPICSWVALLCTSQKVRLTPGKTQQARFLLLTEELKWACLYMYNSLPQATRGIVAMNFSKALPITIPHISLVITNQKVQEPIRHTGALLRLRLRVSLTQIIEIRPMAHKLRRRYNEHTTTCKTHSHTKQQF
jgi:hypothetical protein